MKTIPLTRGKVCVVDDGDYAELSKYKWHCTRQGYAGRNTLTDGARTVVLMHRILLNPPDGREVDHCSTNKIDNRRCNLRVATRAQNSANKGLTKSNTSGRKGVWWDSLLKKWRAAIYTNGRRVYLGCFLKLEDAGTAYEGAAIHYHRNFARWTH